MRLAIWRIDPPTNLIDEAAIGSPVREAARPTQIIARRQSPLQMAVRALESRRSHGPHLWCCGDGVMRNGYQRIHNGRQIVCADRSKFLNAARGCQSGGSTGAPPATQKGILQASASGQHSSLHLARHGRARSRNSQSEVI